ncbi:methyltransferase domain-containing protein [Clostridium sp. YIM B02505]|uniref:Methyltransferase domain-containing protein n=1 Tax=Clostridium yunnanense TaxID=2800325 RepID=A0ABS1EV37_9CLOT|nr:methyltransferase domain-containing protein [Clostridium yunnanense]MBK1813227.1 methyltransferase domain-containing protein [Clostridium yunnanense]
MDLRLTFNEVASEYDRMRPLYAEELFEDVIKYTDLDSSKNALEIGIGTGQATLPFLKSGCKVTAIELGSKMAAFTKEKFSEFENFNVINDDFESIVLENNSYDLIYSASAFQWINPQIGYPKVLELLKSGGAFAKFSHSLYQEEEFAAVASAMDKVYDKYRNDFYTDPRISLDKVHEGYKKVLTSMNPPSPHNKERSLEHANWIKQYGFSDVIYKCYHQTLTYDSESYVSLISTYCDQIALPENTRKQFAKEIKEAIDSNGGKFGLSDTIDLYLAIKS